MTWAGGAAWSVVGGGAGGTFDAAGVISGAVGYWPAGAGVGVAPGVAGSSSSQGGVSGAG